MKAFVLLVLAVIAQATVFQHLKGFGVAFDAVLAVVIVAGFVGDGYQRIMIPALLAGMLSDSMSGAPFATAALGLTVAAFALSALSGVLAREHVVHFAVFAVVGVVVFSATTLFITALLRPHALSITPIGVLSVIGYNGAGAFLFYFVYRWIILLKNRIGGR